MGLESVQTSRAEAQLDEIVSALYTVGYVVLERVFDEDYLCCLLKELLARKPAEFHTAGIGRDMDFQKNHFIRSDRIHWLQGHEGFLSDYQRWAECLRLAVNRRLFLGLFDYECMFAHYPAGAFYKRHLDAFNQGINRRLSTVLYLNPQWGSNDGGELLMYAPDSDELICRVLPCMGTMVLFLSEEFPHEVLPAQRSRYSLTGWFRVNEGIATTDMVHGHHI
ncbi:MAG: 2OG-Fe(II) oxygenase [Marinicella pacifica]